MIAGKAPSLIAFFAMATAAASFSAAAVIHRDNVTALKEYGRELATLERAVRQLDTVSYRQAALGMRLARSTILDEPSPDEDTLPPIRAHFPPNAPEQQPEKQPSNGPTTGSDALPRGGVAITYPIDNALVENDALVRGTVAASITNDIWVFVWPKRAPGMGWPQSPNAAEGAPAVRDKEKNEWATPVGFGGPAQSYEIAVYTANKTASIRVGNVLKRWAKDKEYPGMTSNQLEGLVERHRITVRKP
jgi:hypothetical protein